MQNSPGLGVARIGFFLDIMELVEHQQCIFEAAGGHIGHGGVIEQFHQGADVVAAQHGAKQLGGLLPRQQRTGLAAMRHRCQITGLDLGGVIDTGRHAVSDQVHQGGLLTGGRALEQLDQFTRLLGRQGQRRDAQGSTLGHVGTVIL